jgi:hypothetical protein
MTYQTRPCFPYDVQHFGCYLFSICFLLDRQFNLGIFMDAGMLKIYQDEEADRDLGAESFVDSPQHLCDHVAGEGKVSFEEMHYPADHQCNPGELEVQCWFNPATNFHHFVAAENGRMIYDPIEGGSRTVREGHCESKRVFRVLG